MLLFQPPLPLNKLPSPKRAAGCSSTGGGGWGDSRMDTKAGGGFAALPPNKRDNSKRRAVPRGLRRGGSLRTLGEAGGCTHTHTQKAAAEQSGGGAGGGTGLMGSSGPGSLSRGHQAGFAPS